MDDQELLPIELDIMELLWDDAPRSVRETVGALAADGTREKPYTTVLTAMVRLFERGLLTRTRERRTDFYGPALTREQWLDHRAGSRVDAILDEAGEVALVHFVRQLDALAPELRAQLEALARSTSPTD